MINYICELSIFCVLTTTTESRTKIRYQKNAFSPLWLRQAVFLLVLIHCLLLPPLFVGVLQLVLVCYVVLSVVSSLTIILTSKRERAGCFTSIAFLMSCDC